MGNILDVRYSELRFTVRVLYDSILPRFKASAIRGSIGDFIDYLNRRIYSLNCFEGNEYPDLLDKEDRYPTVLGAENRPVRIPRYSFRKKQKIFLDGIYGNIDIDISELDNKNEYLRRLAAGEVIHIGSNTSFGFGGYTLSKKPL